MDLTFTLNRPAPDSTSTQHTTALKIAVDTCIVAGWAGRNLEAIEEHIEELAELGVPRPSAVPLYYRIAANQLIQDDTIEVVGDQSSGEAEVLVFSNDGKNLVSLASDHTDRKLEAHSVALSKQVCAKPVAQQAWLLDDVADHWDQLILRSWITENGQKVLYQEGTTGTLKLPQELIQDHFGQDIVPEGSVMYGGTVNVIGGIRPATDFIMELHDPVLERSLHHRYSVRVLPEIA